MKLLYRTIVADPPWKYDGGCWDRPVSRSSNHYETLTKLEIGQFPITRFLANDAYLFLWTPNRFIMDGTAAAVAMMWNFRPITTMAWVKPSIGLGYYIRNSHENILFGVHGSPGPFKRKNFPSWFEAPRGKHSEKPDFGVETICDGPYLELFGRREREGWDVFGNEVGDPLDIGFNPDTWGLTNA